MLKIILAIVLFSVIVIFHELGHFLLAKTNYFWKADRRDQVFRKVSSIWRLLCYAWRR